MKKHVIFSGASLVNLYGAKILIEKNYQVTIYEKSDSLTNDNNRIIPALLFKKLSIIPDESRLVNIRDNTHYSYKIKELKQLLLDDFPINFNVSLTIDSTNKTVKDSQNKIINFDYIILRGKEDKILDNFFFYTYEYENIKHNLPNIYQNKGLTLAFDKMDKIIEIIA